MFSIPFDKDIVRLPLNLSDIIWVLFISLENYVRGIKLSKYMVLFIHICILWFHGVEEVPYLSIHAFPWITTIFHSRPFSFYSSLLLSVIFFLCRVTRAHCKEKYMGTPLSFMWCITWSHIFENYNRNVIIVVEMILFVHLIKHLVYPSRCHAWILTNVNLGW